MTPLKGPRIPVRLADRHTYICDLLYFEGPILSLYRDQRQSWFYLWCDTNSRNADRWVLFPVSRKLLVAYLQRHATLRDLIDGADAHWILDIRRNVKKTPSERDKNAERISRTLRKLDLDAIPTEYLPTPDSYFDESLSPDISLAREIQPSTYHVDIGGNWFFSDLDHFSRLYHQVYAFFYATKPRFVTNVGQKLQRFLHAPWQGGFSRVNLFSALESFVPSLHDLEIKRIQYSSPGAIQIEALASVGSCISSVVAHYINNENLVADKARKLNGFLAGARLKKRDVSHLSDAQINLSRQNKEFLMETNQSIVSALQINADVAEITSHAPNLIVTTKLLLALVKRIRNLSELQKNGLISLL